MRFGSVCSGIEAASVAWEPLGWECAFVSEIEKFPSAVLAHRFPNVPNLGDFTKIGVDDVGPIDLLVGGTPCQDFSVAGLRAGMAGKRGQLTVEFAELARRLRPRWVVWENVPGVLSIDGGRAFGTFLGLLGELGYGFAYRVLDAQFFGVPQRRRRVFVVGYLGDWRRAAAVLFERSSLSGHPAPRRKAGAIAAALTRDGLGGGGPDDNLAQGNHLGAFSSHGPEIDLASTLDTRAGIGPRRNQDAPLVVWSIRNDVLREDPPAVSSHDQTGLKIAEEVAPTVDTGQPHAVAIGSNADRASGGAPMIAFSCKDHGADAGEITPTLRAMNEVAIMQSAVRRLTPRECERLQGFPDDWTLVPYRGKPAADGPRYRSLGNSMAVPCMRWLGERVEALEAA